MRATERFVVTVLRAWVSIKEVRIKAGAFAFLLVAIGVAFALTTVSTGAAEDSIDRVIIGVLSGAGPCDSSGCSLQVGYSVFCENATSGDAINVFIGIPDRASAASLRNKTVTAILADSNVQAIATYCGITFTSKDVFLYGM